MQIHNKVYLSLGASPSTGAATLWGGNQGRLRICFLHQGPWEPRRHSQRCLQTVTGISSVHCWNSDNSHSSEKIEMFNQVALTHLGNIEMFLPVIQKFAFFPFFSPVWRTRWSVSKKQWSTFQLPPNHAHQIWAPHSSVSVKSSLYLDVLFCQLTSLSAQYLGLDPIHLGDHLAT